MNEKDREDFLLKLNFVEQEYNMPGKPESIKDVDRKMIKNKMKTLIDSFCKKYNVTFEDMAKYILEYNNERKGVNPGSKEEYDFIEELIYDISEEQSR